MAHPSWARPHCTLFLAVSSVVALSHGVATVGSTSPLRLGSEFDLPGAPAPPPARCDPNNHNPPQMCPGEARHLHPLALSRITIYLFGGLF